MASNKPGKDVDMSDEYLGKIIEVFKPFLLETLRVSHLLCLLHIQEVKEVAPMVHKKENSGDFKEASRLLLQAISKSEEPGKWRMFIDALREVQDTMILETLLEENGREDDDWLDNQANRNLIQLCSQDIMNDLKLEALLPIMYDKKLILEEDQQKLFALLKEGGPRQANAMLLMLMHRHNSNWYEIFLTILYDNEHYRTLAEYIDPGFCKKKIEQKRAAQAGQSQDASQGGGGGISSPSRPPPARQQSAIKAPTGGGQKASSSLTLNMGAHAGDGEKGMGDKSVPHSAHLAPPPCEPLLYADHRVSHEASCACGCCAQLLSEVQILRSEQAEMKTVHLAQMKTLQSELSEMKALLQFAISNQGPKNRIGNDK